MIPQVLCPRRTWPSATDRPRRRAPRAVPDLPHPDGQARGLGVHPVSQPRLPGAALAAAQAFRRRDGHRRARREAGRAVHGPRLGADGRRLLPSHRRADHRAARASARSRPRSCRGDRGLQAPAVRPRPVRARDRGGRLRDRTQPRPALPDGRCAAESDAGGDRADPGRRSEDGRQDPPATCTTRNARADRGPGAQGVRLEEAGPPPGEGPLAGKTSC